MCSNWYQRDLFYFAPAVCYTGKAAGWPLFIAISLKTDVLNPALVVTTALIPNPGDDVAEFGCGVVREAAAVGISRHVDTVDVEAVVVPYVVHQIPCNVVFFC